MKLSVLISDKRINAAIAEGIILKNRIILDVDLEKLSQSNRELLSRNISYNSGEEIFTAEYISNYGFKHTLCSNSEKLEDILSEMAAHEKIFHETTKKKQIEKELEKKIDAILSKKSTDLVITRYSDDTIYFNKNGRRKEFCPFNRERGDMQRLFDYIQSAEFTNKIISVTDEIEAEEKKVAADNELKAQKEAKIKVLKENLKNWAVKNGSELLKARIEENFNWFSLANKEYNIHQMPEGFDFHDDDEYDSCWPYNDPSLEHINKLREARKNEIFENIELRKCRKAAEDYDDSPVFYYFLVGEIKSFTGEEIFEVSKCIDTETDFE